MLHVSRVEVVCTGVGWWGRGSVPDTADPGWQHLLARAGKSTQAEQRCTKWPMAPPSLPRSQKTFARCRRLSGAATRHCIASEPAVKKKGVRGGAAALGRRRACRRTAGGGGRKVCMLSSASCDAVTHRGCRAPAVRWQACWGSRREKTLRRRLQEAAAGAQTDLASFWRTHLHTSVLPDSPSVAETAGCPLNNMAFSGLRTLCANCCDRLGATADAAAGAGASPASAPWSAPRACPA